MVVSEIWVDAGLFGGYEDFKIVLNAWWNEKNFFEKWKDENYRKLV